MKLLIVNTLYHPYKIGGAEMSVKALAEKLKSLGAEVAILTLAESNCKDKINGIMVWRLKIKNLFWPFNQGNNSGLKKLLWHKKDIYNRGYDNDINVILDSFNPDIMLTNNLSGFSIRIWDIAKSRNIKIVHVIRDYYLQCPKTTKFKNGHNCSSLCISCKLLSYRKKVASINVDYVVGISNHVLQDHLNYGILKRLE